MPNNIYTYIQCVHSSREIPTWTMFSRIHRINKYMFIIVVSTPQDQTPMGSSGDMALYMSSHNERTPDPQRRIIIIIIKNGIYQVSALHGGTKRNVVNAFFIRVKQCLHPTVCRVYQSQTGRQAPLQYNMQFHIVCGSWTTTIMHPT